VGRHPKAAQCQESGSKGEINEQEEQKGSKSRLFSAPNGVAEKNTHGGASLAVNEQQYLA